MEAVHEPRSRIKKTSRRKLWGIKTREKKREIKSKDMYNAERGTIEDSVELRTTGNQSNERLYPSSGLSLNVNLVQKGKRVSGRTNL